MARKLSDPAIRKGFEDIVAGARDKLELACISTAEQDVIAYYYDTLRAMAIRRIAPDHAGSRFPDTAPMRKAVKELNRACANQKKKYLFNGNVTDPADLFAFASGICMPAAQA